nr:putative serine/threonine-protein kinase [Ipomoea batatas]
MSCCFLFSRKLHTSPTPAPEFQEEFSGIENVTFFSYSELEEATDDFSSRNKIGEGGFGSVYKGTLKNGEMAAIKVLSAKSVQGVREFLTEIKVISDIDHENLVKLYGCCVEDSQRILVYNYLENNSLALTLLGFAISYKSNAAFRGYLAPEYAVRGQLTYKADIYSFGVLLMEIVCGRCNTNTRLPVGEQYLLEKTWRLYERGEMELLVDSLLGGEFDAEEACRYLKVGLLCTQDAPKLRPSMSTIVKMLIGEEEIDSYKITKPGLISDFLDLKIKNAPRPNPGKVNASYNQPPTSSSDNSTLPSESPSQVTTFTTIAKYDSTLC